MTYWEKAPDHMAYMVEVNPWTPDAELRRAVLYRGAIVSGWAQVEYFLSTVALRSSYDVAYKGMIADFPYRLENRLKYLRRVLAAPGPLAPYAGIGRIILDAFVNASEHRHVMAHARMQLLPHWGVTFHDFKKTGPGAVLSRRQRFSLEELQRIAERTARLARRCQRAELVINQRALLPPLT